MGLNGYLIPDTLIPGKVGFILISPDLDITWYDTNGNVLASGVDFYDVDSSISGVYVTVEYEGVNYGMSPEDAFQVNTPAEFNGLDITGNLTRGSTVTADYQITDANGWNGVAEVRWYNSDDLNTVVGTGQNYVLSANDIGKQLYFEVSFTDDDGFRSLSDIWGHSR